MTRNIDPSSAFRRAAGAALVLITLLPLAACGADSLAQDLFGDAASECGDLRERWRPGCATMRNIAAQAEHPGDLDTPRGEGPRDAMRRDAQLSGYAGRRANGEPPAPGQPGSTSGGRKEP